MKIALIAITENGLVLAQRIKNYFKADIYAKQESQPNDKIKTFDRLSDLIANIFFRYDAFVFIMATGIVVRMIAPYINHKKNDPAIVVLDEKGIHAISLLSGHLGGANELTQEIAEKIGAQPVITTATDVNQTIAVDVIAKKLQLSIMPFDRIKIINGALAQGQTVDIYLDVNMCDAKMYEATYNANFSYPLKLMQRERLVNLNTMAIFISDRNITLSERQILLKPRKISIGIGCRKNTSSREIRVAVQAACERVGIPMHHIVNIASTVAKKAEQGILELAKELAVPVVFYENDELQEMIVQYHMNVSEFVKEQIGVGNVCEAAVMKISQSKKIILHKMKFNKTTVAIAWAE